MAEAAPKPMDLLQGLKGALLWIGGSLAGISAILYTCGYLVTRAHLSMLGLFGLVDYGADHFLQEGAKFAIAVGFNVLHTLLPFLAIAGLGALLGALAARALSRSHLEARLSAVRGRVHRFRYLRHALFAALFAGLLFHVGEYLDDYECPLRVANLLYADPDAAATANDCKSRIDHWLLGGDAEQLSRQFDVLLIGLLIAAALVIAALRVVAPLPLRRYLAAPFVVALGLYVVALPMAYGVLVRPVRYALVTISDAPDAASRTFLLSKSSDAFVVWDAKARRVIWLPASGQKRAVVYGVANLFGKDDGTTKEARK